MLNPAISILVPSRGRPDQLDRMWSSAREHAHGTVELVVRLDDDDPALEQYRDVLDDATLIIGPRTVLSVCWNECWENASASVFHHAGDDIVYRTPGWDRLVLDAMAAVPDRIVFVYGRDGYQDEKLGTHGFLHQRWAEAVGYFVPPFFSSDFNDLWIFEVAGMIDRRRYLPDLFTEHMHPCAGKGEWDLTHRERLARHKKDRPEVLYRRLAEKRHRDAKLLRSAMGVVVA